MTAGVATISLSHLALAFVPVVVAVVVLQRWTLDARAALHAMARMLVQLLLIGYVLAFIFQTESSAVVLSVLMVMLLAASWIAVRPLRQRGRRHFLQVLGAITVGGASTLALVSYGVLQIEPWYSPRHLIPLAGMIFANAMNTISIAAERLEAECDNGVAFLRARNVAMNAALIPITNSLFAVGLVSLPGMMTGQILSGVEPTVAARYQIMVMCMIYGSSGIAAACYLAWVADGREPQAVG